MKQYYKALFLSYQDAKKIIFTTCHSGKLKLAFTSPNVISTSPKSFLTSRIDSQFFLYLNCSKNITCPSGKLKTKFAGPIAKSTSPGLSDTTFFTRCIQTLDRKQYFTILQNKLHSFSIKDNGSTRGLLAKPLKKFPKSPIRPSGSHFCSASCGECLNEH